MKKIICFLFLALLSCDKDEPETADNTTYSVSIQKDCPNGARTSYNISKSTYDQIDSQVLVGQACQFISFKDLNLKSYSGYFRSLVKVN